MIETTTSNAKQAAKENILIEKTIKLKDSMQKDGCELISSYNNCENPVYLFNGYECKTTPYKLYRGHRAHKVKCISYTQNHIPKIFTDERCELLSQYKNQKAKLQYKYKDKIYIFNDWYYRLKRPHENALNQKLKVKGNVKNNSTTE